MKNATAFMQKNHSCYALLQSSLFKNEFLILAKAQRYSMEQIQTAQKILRALAFKKSENAKKKVVEFLAEDMRKVVKERHRLKTIRDTLGKSDIPFSLARMKSVLGDGGEV